MITLETLRRLRYEMGLHTVLGVSNISFGLPERVRINTAFFTMAMQNGLSAGIVNPSSESMMAAYYSFNALIGEDDNCMEYIRKCTEMAKTDTPAAKNGNIRCIISGRRHCKGVERKRLSGNRETLK